MMLRCRCADVNGDVCLQGASSGSRIVMVMDVSSYVHGWDGWLFVCAWMGWMDCRQRVCTGVWEFKMGGRDGDRSRWWICRGG